MAPNRKLHWDGTVTAGNVLTVIVIVVAVLAWNFRLEGRVDHNEYRVGQVEVRLERSVEVLTDAINESEDRVIRQIDGLASQVGRIESILLQPERASP